MVRADKNIVKKIKFLLHGIHIGSMWLIYCVKRYAKYLCVIVQFFTAQEFVYDQSPVEIRSLMMGIFQFSVGIGSYIGSALVNIVNTAPGTVVCYL